MGALSGECYDFRLFYIIHICAVLPSGSTSTCFKVSTAQDSPEFLQAFERERD